MPKKSKISMLSRTSVAIAILVLSLFLQLFTPLLPEASATTLGEARKRVSDYSYYTAVRYCLRDTAGGRLEATLDANDIDPGSVFATSRYGNNEVRLGFVADGHNDKGAISCRDLYKKVANTLFSSSEDFLRALGYVRSSDGTRWTLSGAQPATQIASWDKFAEGKGIKNEPPYAYYYLAMDSLEARCGVSKVKQYTTVGQYDSDASTEGTQGKNQAGSYRIWLEVDEMGSLTPTLYKIDEDKLNDYSFAYPRTDFVDNAKCDSVIDAMVSSTPSLRASQAYAADAQRALAGKVAQSYLAPLKPIVCTTGAGGEYTRCVGSLTTAITKCILNQFTMLQPSPALPLKVKYSPKPPDPSSIDNAALSKCIATEIGNNALQPAIEIAIVNVEVGGSCPNDYAINEQGDCEAMTPPPAPGGGEENTTTCSPEIGALGWIICPTMGFLATISDGLYSFISDQLAIPPEILETTGDNTQTYEAWKIFRNYANILFVIVFLAIVYSQLTGAGINNYGIKKMLPKLIIAAILVNLSFVICQLAVDLSNILGFGIKSIFDSMGAGLPAGEGESSWRTVVGGVLAGAVGIIALLLAISVPTLIAVVLALGSAALILIAQKALVILLIAVSPIAFVLYLLPNTESIFKKWLSLFKSLLLLFPIISLLFGAGALAANILGGIKTPGMQIAALAATALPLIAIFPALQGALKGTGALGAKLAGWNGKSLKGIGKSAADKLKNRTTVGSTIQNALQYRQQQRNISLAKKRGKGLSRVIGGPLGGKGYVQYATRRGDELEDEERNKDIAAYDRQIVTETSGDMDKVVEIATNKDVDYVKRDAAIRRVMEKGSYDQKLEVVRNQHTIRDQKTRDMLAGAYAKSDLSAAYGTGIAGTISKGPRKLDNGELEEIDINLSAEAAGNFKNLTASKLVQHPNVVRDVVAAYPSATPDQKEYLTKLMDIIERTPEMYSQLAGSSVVSLQSIDKSFGHSFDSVVATGDQAATATTASPTPQDLSIPHGTPDSSPSGSFDTSGRMPSDASSHLPGSRNFGG